jgi:AbrB family looped-hinge helix DNA binding protein
METTLSSKGQIVLPAEVRRRLKLTHGSRLSVEIRDGGVLLKSAHRVQGYLRKRNPVSGLTVMVPTRDDVRKVSAREIAQLHADLL